MTMAIRALGILPALTFVAIAVKFEPRPERRMPRFFNDRLHAPGLSVLSADSDYSPRGRRHSGILRVQHFPLTFDDAANVVELFSGAVEQRLSLLEFLSRNHQ